MLGELVGLVWFIAVSAALIREWRTGSLAFEGRRRPPGSTTPRMIPVPVHAEQRLDRCDTEYPLQRDLSRRHADDYR